MTPRERKLFQKGLQFVLTPKRPRDSHTAASLAQRDDLALKKLGFKGVAAKYLFKFGYVGYLLYLAILVAKFKSRAILEDGVLIADHPSAPLRRSISNDFRHLTISDPRGPSVVDVIFCLFEAAILIWHSSLLNSASVPQRVHGITYVLHFLAWRRYLSGGRRLNKALFCDDFTGAFTGLYIAVTVNGATTLVYSMHKRPWPYLPPARCNFYLHWGDIADDEIKMVCDSSVLLVETQKRINTSRLKSLPDKDLRVLLVLNAFFSRDCFPALKKYTERFGKVSLRPHPRSDINAFRCNLDLKIATLEPLDKVASRYDLSICASTSAASQILAAGCPIAYDQGLDPPGMRDEYKYVENGKLPEIKGGDVDIQSVGQFYDCMNSENLLSLDESGTYDFPDTLANAVKFFLAGFIVQPHTLKAM